MSKTKIYFRLDENQQVEEFDASPHDANMETSLTEMQIKYIREALMNYKRAKDILTKDSRKVIS